MKTALMLSAIATGVFLLSSSVMRAKGKHMTSEDAANRIDGRAHRGEHAHASDDKKYGVTEWTRSHQPAT